MTIQSRQDQIKALADEEEERTLTDERRQREEKIAQCLAAQEETERLRAARVRCADAVKARESEMKSIVERWAPLAAEVERLRVELDKALRALEAAKDAQKEADRVAFWYLNNYNPPDSWPDDNAHDEARDGVYALGSILDDRDRKILKLPPAQVVPSVVEKRKRQGP